MQKRQGFAIAAAVFAVAVVGCAGGGGNSGNLQAVPKAPAPPPEVLPPAAGASRTSSLRGIQSPYVRTNPDGTTLHVYPLPQVRNAFAASRAAASRNVNYHGGKVIDNSVTYAIYWVPPGYSVSAKYESVINEFFNDVGATPAYQILTQYSDTDGNPLNASSLGGSWVDTRPFPSPMNDSVVRQEVLRAISVNGWPAGGIQPIFFVFTASKAKVSFAYCAYHGNFPHNGNQVIYSIVPYQRDLGPHGCGTPSTVFPNDQAADLTIDTLWHELGESVSDPVNAWYRNSDGQEIGDICSSAYGPLRKDGSDVTLHDHNYVTQQLYSNHGSECEQTYE